MTAVAANVLASILVAAGVAFALILCDAPTWAWVGAGLITYLHEVKFPKAVA